MNQSRTQLLVKKVNPRLLISSAIFAAIGTVTLVGVFANQASYIALEAESSTNLSSNTEKIYDTEASGGESIRFTAPTTTPSPTPTPTATAPMWHADADADSDAGDHTSFWKKEVTSGDMTKLSIVDDPKNLYGKVYMAYLTPAEIASDNKRAEWAQALLGDGNTKLKLANDTTPKGSTQEIYFGWKSLFGSDLVIDPSHSNDGNFMQLKGDSSCGGPAVGMTIRFGKLVLRSERELVEYQQSAWVGPDITSLYGTWQDFVLHVKFAKDNTGYLEVWHNNQPQIMTNGQTRIYFPTVCPNDTYIYPKLGVYGMDIGTGTGPHHWIESPRIGTTFDSVKPAN